MPVQNTDIAATFDEIADLLDIRGDNPFRIRAYRNAARTVQGLGVELRDMVVRGDDLTAVPGIGADLAAKIREQVETGSLRLLQDLRSQFPPGITDLLRIPGLGPKRVKMLYRELHIESPADLEKAARAGKIRELDGFGAKTEQNLLAALQAHADSARRFLRARVAGYAEDLAARLRDAPGAGQVAVAGSYRRARDTVGDLDVLVTAQDAEPVMERFAGDPGLARVLARGPTKSSAVLPSGLQVDVRVVEDKSFGAALHYFTGSKAHNIAIRKLGQQRGLKVNEYGVFREEEWLAGRTEEEVYAALGLPWIPPELREDTGEIAAAAEGRLPPLVEESDLRGDLHVHTTASDGQNSLRDMALAAQQRGYSYIAITDHSPRLAVVHGLNAKRLLDQAEEIDRVNAELKGITVLKGMEVDILEDGRLDLPDEVLGGLDVVIAAVHSHFKLPADKQTERIMRAMDRPCVHILAHPTGRLLLEREPYEVDMPRLIRHARECGCCLELNAHPVRLDLNDTHCRLAKAEGVPVCINTDAHSVAELQYASAGIAQARRGWLEKGDVLNTKTIASLRKFLSAKK